MNLLPWRARLQRRRLWAFAGGVAAAALGGVAAVAWAALQVSARTAELRAVNAELSAQVAARDADLVAADGLAGAAAEIERRAARLAELGRRRGAGLAVLDALAAAATEGVRFTRVALDGATVTVEGDAASPARVSALLAALRGGGRFEAPALRAIGHADAAYGPDSTTFSLSASLSTSSPASLSASSSASSSAASLPLAGQG